MNRKIRPHDILCPVPFERVELTQGFWLERQKVNFEKALFLQHQKLEEYHHIDNLRVAAGQKKGIFRGAFFFDSDLYKWLEAACYSLQLKKNPELKVQIEEIVDLIVKAQDEEGYLDTYYQILFPEKRFSNLLVFHELYCMGHFFQAAIAHYSATRDDRLISVSSKCVDLLIQKFFQEHLKGAPGHQEIELALLDLYHLTEEEKYLKLARELVERRGKIPKYKRWALKSFTNMIKTLKKEKKLTKQYEKETKESYDVEHAAPKMPFKHKLKGALRFIREFLNGKYAQYHVPATKMEKPVGHAVRAMYFYIAMAKLYAETGNQQLLDTLQKIWQNMVEKRMYITGGTGSIGVLEGFGKDFELDPESSYSETCAAIGNMLWNWEMTQITADPKYADLVERLMFNAMLVGQSIEGTTYMYNNPLKSNGKNERHEWYYVACCPSNIARTIASLGKYIYSTSKEGIYIHQYISNKSQIPLSEGQSSEIEITMTSNLPWQGLTIIHLDSKEKKEFSLYLRIPKWAKSPNITINTSSPIQDLPEEGYLELKREWSPGDRVSMDFNLTPQRIKADPRNKYIQSKVAIQYGPLIYCLEQIDNPEMDIFKAKIAKDSHLKAYKGKDILKKVNIIEGTLASGHQFKAIPYFAWNNRGPNKMQVWMDYEQ